MNSGIVIIGAGVCGVSAALSARNTGYEGSITLLDQENRWPYERPLLSKWDEQGPRLKNVVEPQIYEDEKINLLLGREVTSIDRAESIIRFSNGEAIEYDKLLIATGASARRLDDSKLLGAQIHYLRGYTDAQELFDSIKPNASVLIVGGGFIGLELAASLTSRTNTIRLVEAQRELLSRAVPSEISRLIRKLHTSHGISIETGVEITLAENGKAHLSNGCIADCEHIVVGIGSVPNTVLASLCGLEVANGIIVDSSFATADPKIFAAGDCCSSIWKKDQNRRFESWLVAEDQGTRVGQVMVRGNTPRTPQPIFWSDQFDHSLHVVGVSEKDVSKHTRLLGNGALIVFELNSQLQLSKATGFGPGNSVSRDIKLARKIIEAQVPVKPDEIIDPEYSLKSLLNAAASA